MTARTTNESDGPPEVREFMQAMREQVGEREHADFYYLRDPEPDGPPYAIVAYVSRWVGNTETGRGIMVTHAISLPRLRTSRTPLPELARTVYKGLRDELDTMEGGYEDE